MFCSEAWQHTCQYLPGIIARVLAMEGSFLDTVVSLCWSGSYSLLCRNKYLDNFWMSATGSPLSNACPHEILQNLLSFIKGILKSQPRVWGFFVHELIFSAICLYIYYIFLSLFISLYCLIILCSIFIWKKVQRAEIVGLLMNTSEEAVLDYQVSLNNLLLQAAIINN